MYIRAGYELTFEAAAATPLVAMMNLRPERHIHLLSPHAPHTGGASDVQEYLDAFGNICTRMTLPPGRTTLSCDFVVEDSGEADPQAVDAAQHDIGQLPPPIMMYLLGSRYCDTDRLSDVAWNLFGHVPAGWQRVQAIVDYVHEHLTYGYEHARPTRTAWEAYEERVGVCRDFAHLAVALCRCMNIPARYCSGYLGDIGIPPVDIPMDFHAWFEAYLGGRWYSFDARHRVPRIGRLLMACGRDAADTALTTVFGPVQLIGFQVVTEECAAPLEEATPLQIAA